MQPIEIQAAFALFRSACGDWLVQWNRHWQAYNLIGGRVESGESFFDCAMREVCEELGLALDDFTLSPDPIAKIDFRGLSSDGAVEATYCMQLFAARAAEPQALETLASLASNRWLTLAEIYAGLTSEGKRISEVTQRFAAELGLRNAGSR